MCVYWASELTGLKGTLSPGRYPYYWAPHRLPLRTLHLGSARAGACLLKVPSLAPSCPHQFYCSLCSFGEGCLTFARARAVN